MQRTENFYGEHSRRLFFDCWLSEADLDVFQYRAISWFLALLIGVIILSGLYPAFVLARFNPATALTNQTTTRLTGKLTVRQALILGQFVLMQLFILSVLVITTQLRHMQQTVWGFHHESILAVFLPQQESAPLSTLRERWGASTRC